MVVQGSQIYCPRIQTVDQMAWEGLDYHKQKEGASFRRNWRAWFLEKSNRIKVEREWRVY